jgi:hypothetical protein
LPEHGRKGIARGWPVVEPQHRLLGFSKQRHVGARLGAAQRRGHGDEQDLNQIVPCVGGTRIRERRENFGKCEQGDLLSKGVPLRIHDSPQRKSFRKLPYAIPLLSPGTW